MRIFQSIKLAGLIGVVLALYISLTMLWQMSYGLWLTLHNGLVVISLLIAVFIGYKQKSFSTLLISIAVFYLIITLLYIGSYAITTAFFDEQMVWIPFFYHDYNYHGFASVKDYLNHKNNFWDLLELQIIMIFICSVLYFVAGILGYGLKAMIDGIRVSLFVVPRSSF